MPETFVQDTGWCELVFHLVRLLLKRDDGRSNLRYVVVGNLSRGFCGVTEWEMDSSTHMNDHYSRLWGYTHLNERECRRILKERLYV